MVNLNFGGILGTFFHESAKLYDKPSTENKNFLVIHSTGHKGKFSTNLVQLKIFEHFSVKLGIYAGSFGLKFITWLYLEFA